jgi:hypothetical protein
LYPAVLLFKNNLKEVEIIYKKAVLAVSPKVTPEAQN